MNRGFFCLLSQHVAPPPTFVLGLLTLFVIEEYCFRRSELALSSNLVETLETPLDPTLMHCYCHENEMQGRSYLSPISRGQMSAIVLLQDKAGLSQSQKPSSQEPAPHPLLDHHHIPRQDLVSLLLKELVISILVEQQTMRTGLYHAA